MEIRGISSPKNFKNPLEETGCLSNLYYLLAANQGSSFLIHSTFPNTVRPHLVASTSLCSPYVNYRTP